MRKTLRCIAVVSIAVSLLTACEKPVSTGPFHTYVVVEQWFSVHDQKITWDSAVVPVHRDDRAPSWRQLDSSCQVYVGDWGDQTERPPSFGTVKIQGARGGERALSSDPSGHYYKSPGADAAWDTGDVVKVVAAGGSEAPAFTVEGTFPAAPSAVVPDLRAAQPYSIQIARDQPFAVTWNATGAPATVTVDLDQFRLSPLRSDYFLHCTFPGSAGAGSLPTSALSLFQKTTDSVKSNLYIGGVALKDVTVGDHDVSFWLWKADGIRVTIP